MKFPKWNGTTRPSVYLFSLLCFVVGFAVMTAVSLGQLKYDERKGPGWNPISRMPDGKVGLSEFAISTLGFVSLGLGFAAFFGLGLLWNYFRLS